MVATIDSASDWWETVERKWDQIVDLSFMWPNKFDPMALVPDYMVGDGITFVMNNREAMQFCRKRQDRRLARFLYGIWEAAPDSGGIHSLDGWGDLCDLCSEEWVFDEDESRVIESGCNNE